ncbi:ATP-dependent helicase [Bacillus sp. Bva_UNVM-123]|uniref:ATP-dependent helicase n=1 Tax=Bacillus sp. Bva_UNVM-123 TaxID=2829798 RepID=UPI00391F6C4E
MKEKGEFFARKKREIGVFLNETQQKAVLETEGPLLLLASPGSGKTTTIIMRIGYLIEEKGVSPAKIKAITFSRASANDMKIRFSRFFPDLPQVNFSTIHSFAFEVVRDYFRKKAIPYQIIEGGVDLEEKEALGATEIPLHKKLILRNLYKTIVEENITDDQMEELTTYISFIKNKMIPTSEWSTVRIDVPKAEEIFCEYETFKKSGYHKLLVDFDDMLTLADEILNENPSLLQKYQQRYDYILTDESQDTSLVQHKIIEKLVAEHKNLFVVADDDQSIYSWRGAEPSYLLNFKEVYHHANTLFLEQNYRSSNNIVNIANQFIKRNKNRYNKNMFTNNPPSNPIVLKEFADYIFQAKYLVQEIRRKDSLTEIAILYRNNSSSIALINEFDRAGIPFYMKDADNRFFSHWVVADILNFMRMTFTDKRPDILEKIHLKLHGYISKKQMAALKEIKNHESVFDNLLNHIELQSYQIKQVNETKETFQQMKGMPPLQAIEVIREKLGYEKALEKMCERLGFRKDYLIGILNTLEEIADTLETMEEFASRLKHLEHVLKTSKSKKGQNAVTFSTFHSAKGLEFDHVYMMDLVEGVIPSSDDAGLGEGDALEEATRLFYVGMTRAKNHLELLSYGERDGKKARKSRFVTAVENMMEPPNKVEELASSQHTPVKGIQEKTVEISYNPNALRNKEELVIGRFVKHRVFGTGIITKINTEQICLQFNKNEKTFLVSTCLELGLLELV